MDRMVAMETLVAVVDAGSFSGAARVLDVGQPAVSKTVAQLEEKLGVRLLIRSTRGLTPTEAGTRFYEHARHAIEASQEAETAARGSGADLTGRLRVSAAVTFSRMHLVPHLAGFMAQHPHLSIDVLLEDGNVDLLALGIDVALRMGNLGDSSMTARRIAQSPRLVVGTPRYFARAGAPGSPAELATHQAVVYDRLGGGTTWSFRRGSSEVSVEVSGRLRVTAAEGVRAAVLSDMGVAVGSAWMFAPELASGDVRPVLTDWTLPPVDLWAVYPSGRMPSTKARAFVDFVEGVLASQAVR